MKKLIQFSFLLMLSESIFAQSYTITPNSAGSKISNSAAPFTIGMRSGFSGVIDFMRGAAFSAGIRNSAIVKQLRLGIGDIYIDSNADIVIDSTTRYIGIRTINPLAQLHIKAGTSNVNPFANTNLFLENNNHNYLHLGATDGFDNGILFSNVNDNPNFGGGIIYKSDDRMSFVMNGGTSRMLINSSGNVGIGTTTPAHKLDVNGNVNSSTGFTVNSSPIAGYYFATNWTAIPASSVDSTFDGTCIKTKRIMVPELTADVMANGEISVFMRTSSFDTKALKLPYISDAGGATNQISAFAKKPGEIIVYRHTLKSCRFNSGVPESYTGEPVMINHGSSLEFRVVIIKQ